jgi:thyrotropin-releasing hormone receptor
MLACVDVIFATLWLPYRGLLVYNSFATMTVKPAYMDLWYLMFAKTCIYMNW